MQPSVCQTISASRRNSVPSNTHVNGECYAGYSCHVLMAGESRRAQEAPVGALFWDVFLAFIMSDGFWRLMGEVLREPDLRALDIFKSMKGMDQSDCIRNNKGEWVLCHPNIKITHGRIAGRKDDFESFTFHTTRKGRSITIYFRRDSLIGWRLSSDPETEVRRFHESEKYHWLKLIRPIRSHFPSLRLVGPP